MNLNRAPLVNPTTPVMATGLAGPVTGIPGSTMLTPMVAGTVFTSAQPRVLFPTTPLPPPTYPVLPAGQGVVLLQPQPGLTNQIQPSVVRPPFVVGAVNPAFPARMSPAMGMSPLKPVSPALPGTPATPGLVYPVSPVNATTIGMPLVPGVGMAPSLPQTTVLPATYPATNLGVPLQNFPATPSRFQPSLGVPLGGQFPNPQFSNPQFGVQYSNPQLVRTAVPAQTTFTTPTVLQPQLVPSVNAGAIGMPLVPGVGMAPSLPQTTVLPATYPATNLGVPLQNFPATPSRFQPSLGVPLGGQFPNPQFGAQYSNPQLVRTAVPAQTTFTTPTVLQPQLVPSVNAGAIGMPLVPGVGMAPSLPQTTVLPATYPATNLGVPLQNFPATPSRFQPSLGVPLGGQFPNPQFGAQYSNPQLVRTAVPAQTTFTTPTVLQPRPLIGVPSYVGQMTTTQRLPSSYSQTMLPQMTTTQRLPSSYSQTMLPQMTATQGLPSSYSQIMLPQMTTTQGLPSSYSQTMLPQMTTTQGLPSSYSQTMLPQVGMPTANPMLP